MKKFKYLALAAAGVIAVSCGGKKGVSIAQAQTAAETLKTMQEEADLPKAMTITATLVEHKNIFVNGKSSNWTYTESYIAKYDLNAGKIEIIAQVEDTDEESLVYANKLYQWNFGPSTDQPELYTYEWSESEKTRNEQEYHATNGEPAQSMEKTKLDELVEKVLDQEIFPVSGGEAKFGGIVKSLKGFDNGLGYVRSELEGGKAAPVNLLHSLADKTDKGLIESYKKLEELFKEEPYVASKSSVSYDNFTSDNLDKEIYGHLTSDALCNVVGKENLPEYTEKGGVKATAAVTQYYNDVKFGYKNGYTDYLKVNASRNYNYIENAKQNGEHLLKEYTVNVTVTEGASSFLNFIPYEKK